MKSPPKNIKYISQAIFFAVRGPGFPGRWPLSSAPAQLQPTGPADPGDPGGPEGSGPEAAEEAGGQRTSPSWPRRRSQCGRRKKIFIISLTLAFPLIR